MNILMLSATFPYPPSRGGTQVRTFNLLKQLQPHRVILVTQVDATVTAEDIQTLQTYVSNLQVFPKPLVAVNQSPIGKATRFGRFWLEGTPPHVRANYSPAMQSWIETAVAHESFDVLTCEHIVNECYVSQKVQALVPRRVLNIHSSLYGTCRQQLIAGLTINPLRDRLSLPLLKRYEQRSSRKFTELVVTTPEDAAHWQALCPRQSTHLVTNGVDLDEFPCRSHDSGGHNLIFAGAMDNFPNIDAAIFLARDVFSEIRQRYPNATLRLVGARPASAVLALQEIPGVIVTGGVSSMVDNLHQATVCVIPMRAGYGIKNKTLEAMAAGIPVVGSDRALEGLLVDGDRVPLRALRANDAPAFVNAISQLFENLELRAMLSHYARTMIEADYTWKQAGQRYCQILSCSLPAQGPTK